jgi:ABC-2 type transport system permease protein
MADMTLIYMLTLRQLTGKWRLLIVVALAAIPILMAFSSTFADPPPTIEEFDNILLNGIFTSAILPIIVIALSTASLGNEVEDNTLGFLALNPIPRWKIVAPKLAAAITVAGVVLVVSGLVSAFIAYDDGRAAVAVAIGLLAGVATYSAIFVWLSLITNRALAFGLVYVFIWEGLFSNFVPGIRVISVREYTLSIAKTVDESGLSYPGDDAVGSATAIIGAALVFTVFFALAVRRLTRMDIP